MSTCLFAEILEVYTLCIVFPFFMLFFAIHVQVLIYNGDEHAALAIGNCQLDQHNPARCGSGSQWGSNIVLKP